MHDAIFKDLRTPIELISEILRKDLADSYGPNIKVSDDYMAELMEGYRPILLKSSVPSDADREVREQLIRALDKRLSEHPHFTLPEDPLFAKLWRATCRLSTDSGVGSGFFAQLPGDYIVTCAHVVDGFKEVNVERFILPHIRERFTATVVALDYSTDLAILQFDASQLVEPQIERLELGVPPHLGDNVFVSGFPLGVDSIRFSRGMVSGYQKVDLHGAPFRGPVIDAASVNSGNSGGPICDEMGRVVGIVAAGPKPIFIDERDGELTIHKIHNANAGLTFSLDPETVRILCSVTLKTQQKIKREFNYYPPKSITFSRKRLARLQAETRGYFDYIRDSSPIGVFSFDDNMRLFLGWTFARRRAPLDSDGLEPLLRRISKTGGSFMLRGTQILLYRQKYKGFITPVELKFEDED